jgi:hypothetical protein
VKRTRNWKSALLILAIGLLALTALAGCRSRSQEPPADSSAAEAPAAAQEPAAEPDSADAGATATAEAQLAVLGGEEEAAEATDAPAEEPVAEPTQPPASEPAEEPAEPAAGGAVVQGTCNHPYYPIRDGVVYRYRMTAPEMDEVEMTIQHRVTGPNSFVTTQTFEDFSTEMEWQCTEEGLIRTSLGMAGPEMPGLEYTIDDMSGVTFPQPDELQVGNTWQSTFKMSGEMSAEGFAMTISMEAVTDNVLAAFEPVTTPAGTFDAAKIDAATTINMEMDIEGMPAMPDITTSTTLWLVEDVGIVKTVSEDPMAGTSVMELVAIE